MPPYFPFNFPYCLLNIFISQVLLENSAGILVYTSKLTHCDLSGVVGLEKKTEKRVLNSHGSLDHTNCFTTMLMLTSPRRSKFFFFSLLWIKKTFWHPTVIDKKKLYYCEIFFVFKQIFVSYLQVIQSSSENRGRWISIHFRVCSWGKVV